MSLYAQHNLYEQQEGRRTTWNFSWKFMESRISGNGPGVFKIWPEYTHWRKWRLAWRKGECKLTMFLKCKLGSIPSSVINISLISHLLLSINQMFYLLLILLLWMPYTNIRSKNNKAALSYHKKYGFTKTHYKNKMNWDINTTI